MKVRYIGLIVVIGMLLLASPSFVSISTMMVEANQNAQDPRVSLSEANMVRENIKEDKKQEENMRTSIKANTETSTRDTHAIICSQIIPGDPRKPGEPVDCAPSQPAVPPPQPTSPSSAGSGDGHGGLPSNTSVSEGKSEAAKEEHKEGPSVTRLSPTSSNNSMASQMLLSMALLWFLLIAKKLAGSYKKRS